MRPFPTATAAALALSLAAAGARAQTAAPVAAASSAAPVQTAAAPRFPDDATGRAARAMVGAINDGRPDVVEAWVRGHVAASTLAVVPAEVHAAELRRIAETSGGVDVVEVLPASGSGSVRMILRTRRGAHHGRMIVRAAGPDGRIPGFGMYPARDPAAERADVWPARKLPEADVVREIETRVDAAAREDRFSGVVLVARGDRVVLHRAWGLAERSFGTANRPDTKFNLGSMPKMFTSIAIAQLVERGELRWTDTLADLLPDYPDREAARKITVHHLLTHTSGLGDIFVPELYQSRERYVDPADYFPLFAGRRLLFEPGAGYSYSNAGFVVLGAIVERLSGERYHDYLRRHVFAPAGMAHTDSYELTQVVPNLAVGYAHFDDDPFGALARRSNVAFLPWKGSPAGGGYSTAPDLLRFARAFRAGRLVRPETARRITDEHAQGAGYGYGFQVDRPQGREVRGHSGGGARSGINADLKWFADGSWTVIVLGNYDAPAAQDLSARIYRMLAHQ